jgi:2-polyprenyl-3-methyl-5-hydroxy-6-metoxy-1,4-benzoquinol methylase
MEDLKQVNEKTRRSFNLAAEKYYELFKDEMEQKEYDQMLLDRFASNFDSRSIICDVGCGPGHITRYLFDKGLDVFGVDISEKCVEIARRENPEMRFQIFLFNYSHSETIYACIVLRV